MFSNRTNLFCSTPLEKSKKNNLLIEMKLAEENRKIEELKNGQRLIPKCGSEFRESVKDKLPLESLSFVSSIENSRRESNTSTNKYNFDIKQKSFLTSKESSVKSNIKCSQNKLEGRSSCTKSIIDDDNHFNDILLNLEDNDNRIEEKLEKNGNSFISEREGHIEGSLKLDFNYSSTSCNVDMELLTYNSSEEQSSNIGKSKTHWPLLGDSYKFDKVKDWIKNGCYVFNRKDGDLESSSSSQGEITGKDRKNTLPEIVLDNERKEIFKRAPFNSHTDKETIIHNYRQRKLICDEVVEEEDGKRSEEISLDNKSLIMKRIDFLLESNIKYFQILVNNEVNHGDYVLLRRNMLKNEEEIKNLKVYLHDHYGNMKYSEVEEKSSSRNEFSTKMNNRTSFISEDVLRDRLSHLIKEINIAGKVLTSENPLEREKMLKIMTRRNENMREYREIISRLNSRLSDEEVCGTSSQSRQHHEKRKSLKNNSLSNIECENGNKSVAVQKVFDLYRENIDLRHILSTNRVTRKLNADETFRYNEAFQSNEREFEGYVEEVECIIEDLSNKVKDQEKENVRLQNMVIGGTEILVDFYQQLPKDGHRWISSVQSRRV